MITLNELIEDLNIQRLEVFLSQADSAPNAKYTGHLLAYHGETILSLACRFGNIAVVRALLERAEDVAGFHPQAVKVDMRTLDGETPLMCAVMNDRIEIVELLLKHGANVNLETMSETTLMMAEKNHNVKMVVLLRAHHAIIKVSASPLLVARCRLSLPMPDSEQKTSRVVINFHSPLGVAQEISPKIKHG